MLAVGALLLTAACGKRTAGNEVPAETKDNRAQPTGTESNDSDTGGIVIGRDVKLTADNPINYSFANVSVHDPSIVEDNGTYYIFGSHLAAAKSKDLMNWELIGSGVNASNPIIPNALEEMREAFEWSKTNTFWAPDVIRLKNGKYYMYYCTCEGSSPLSALGVAVSDDIEGPYRDLGIILKSGMGYDMPSEDGNMYNANVHPNVVDPCLFYDTEGRLWMVYGSYSGGIYILEMDPETGFPLNKGYGKKILGGNHARIEGPFVLYSPETGYYYLFLSFGGLDSKGGYNIRVARSKNPDGPYYDASGNDMINCKGAPGTFFHDPSIEGYGVKLMGGHRFAWIEGEQSKIRFGYLSPGHNSAYYDEKTGKYFLIFHTRFEGRGEVHEVRVHQFFINEDGWPVVAPYRYTGETLGTYTKEQVTGIYKYINHGKSINREAIVSELIQLNEDYTITGAVKGTWKLKDDGRSVEIVIGEEVYKGVFVMQWDEYGKKNVMTFTALSDTGVAIWGSGIWAIE
ncbi:glycoside hydrolase family 43 protein [Thermoclostridium stercorarium]|nr:glycoside hydrolase family 43 protein [Thermoclostridium stercorarium]UZQ86636.1 glycoside hydrolase family 43 protein [Thermoclostridium stercorarium]